MNLTKLFKPQPTEKKERLIHCNACNADYKADRLEQHVKEMHMGR